MKMELTEKIRPSSAVLRPKESWSQSWKKDFRKNGTLYLMVLPVLAFYIMFCYKPMYGALIAFKDYAPRLGISGSEWVGFKNFKVFFTSSDFPRLLRNTLSISITSLIFGFPAPILLALFLNEVRGRRFKKFIQTTTYLPHFISTVVVCGMIKIFVSQTGIIGIIAGWFTGETTNLLMKPENFLPIYVISGIWQQVGWDSIVYLAALSAVDVQQYEAADLDGAGRFQKMFHITLPALQPTVITLFILAVGKIMNVGHEKVLLLYNPAIYETSDVISTYVYRLGFETPKLGSEYGGGII